MIKYLFRILTFTLSIVFVFSLSIYSQTLTVSTSTHFSGSGNCAQCHISDGNAFTTQSGDDVSPTTLWRSTMMANASRDPLWQAKVSAEVAANPALQAVIEDKCATCHMPMGRTESVVTGAEGYTFDEGLADPLSMDGVSCTLCHQIQNSNLGTEASFTGGYDITNVHSIFGPYTNPTTMPMFNMTGYTPVYSEHVHKSELCATCHTLYTPFVDDMGQVAGYFPEQTPYLEWENSGYPDESVECQTCHMPVTEESMLISTRPPSLTTKRSPTWGHEFVGGNVFMGTLIKNNLDVIGATAAVQHFDSTMNKSKRMLQQQAVNLSATAWIDDDTLVTQVLVENLAGHKFPTGFPSRRAWLHVVIQDNNENIVFESGKPDDNGEVAGIDDGYEPHYDEINQPDQVQIYQAIMKDVNGDVTYTLLRGAEYAKDNRIPPKGFTSVSENYQDIAICGNALNDNNFNFNDDGQEGSGSDYVTYKMAIDNTVTDYDISVTMYYQTLAPHFVADLNAYDTDKVTRFSGFYQAMDKAPVEIAGISKSVENYANTGIQDNNSEPDGWQLFNNYPNPFNAGTVIQYTIPQNTFVTLDIYDVTGRKVTTLVSEILTAGTYTTDWKGLDRTGNSVSSGIYTAVLTTNGQQEIIRMLLLK